MDLQKLMERSQEIEQAIVQVANQYQSLIGHKTEIQHWIKQLGACAEEESDAEVVPPAAE